MDAEEQRRGRLLVGLARRGEDQPLAAPCARLSVWALGTARALLKICQKPARLRELAQLDERFDRIRQLTVDARLTPSRRLQARCQRPQDPVGGRSVAD